MNTRYLSCNYDLGAHDKEYFIKFNATNQNWCFVNRKDVTPTNEKNKMGYVKCWLIHQEKNDALIQINDTGDHRLSSFKVSAKDLVSKIRSNTKSLKTRQTPSFYEKKQIYQSKMPGMQKRAGHL